MGFFFKKKSQPKTVDSNNDVGRQTTQPQKTVVTRETNAEERQKSFDDIFNAGTERLKQFEAQHQTPQNAPNPAKGKLVESKLETIDLGNGLKITRETNSEERMKSVQEMLREGERIAEEQERAQHQAEIEAQQRAQQQAQQQQAQNANASLVDDIIRLAASSRSSIETMPVELKQAFVSKYAQLVSQRDEKSINDIAAGVGFVISYVDLKNRGFNHPGGVRFNLIALCVDYMPEYAYRISNLMTPDFFIDQFYDFFQTMQPAEVLEFIRAIKKNVRSHEMLEFANTGSRYSMQDLTFSILEEYLNEVEENIVNAGY